MRAFVFLEFIFGILILGIVSIVCAKLLLHLKEKEIFAQSVTQKNILIQNTLLQITNILSEATNIQIIDNRILFFKDHIKHQIFFQEKKLYFDETILLNLVENFFVENLYTNLLIQICMQKTCLEKIVLKYGD